MKKQYYEKAYEQNNAQLKVLNQKFNRISLIRGVLALLIVVSFIVEYYTKTTIGLYTGFLLIIGFIVLVIIHQKVAKQQKYLLSQKQVLENYFARFDSSWGNFTNCGEDYIKKDLWLSKDLDIFGKNSLFQYINCANTHYGKEKLSDFLVNKNPVKSSIEKRQIGIQEISKKKDFSCHIQTLSNTLKSDKKEKSHLAIEQFIESVEKESKPLSLFHQVMMWSMPFITLFSFSLAIVGVQSKVFLSFGMIFVIVQLFLVSIQTKKNIEILSPIFVFCENIDIYCQILHSIEEESFESVLLKELKEEVLKNKGSVNSLKKLGRIGEMVKTRFGALSYFLVNGFLMWDYHCVQTFYNWKKNNCLNIRKWMNSIGEVEAYISLAIMEDTKEFSTYPKLMDSLTPTLTFDSLRHPLINEEKAVGNSFSLVGQTAVITGSNMSGKTTFLRTIGLNLILAYSGAAVNGMEFNCSIMKLFTSMRVEDNVSEGISTFYAEILRIKEMVDYSKQQLPLLALIDEIFKGTNSTDRIIGASEAIKKLSSPFASTIVSTHDAELCHLENNSSLSITNHHFKEYYVDNQIHFDYKIQKGECQTKNAQHLLRMAGIIE